MRVRVRAVLIVLCSAVIAVACGDDDPTDPVSSISIETGTLAEAIEGQAYTQELEATGGSGGYSWGLAAGSLPAGLTLAPAGAISGTPIAPGIASFRVRATDAAGRTATADLSMTVVQALGVHVVTVPEGMVDEEYALQLQAVGGRGAHTWSVASEPSAEWLSISSTGLLSGTPTSSGTVMATVTLADESAQEATRDLAIVILEPLAVVESSLPAATQGRAYAAQLVATGGDGSYTWSLASGTLPTGMALTSGGALTGTPEDAGTFAFTAQATDGADRSATRAFDLTVERAPTIQTTSLPPADVGEPYNAQLAATGGTGTYDWSLTAGALPDGLTLSAAGSISGTPTTLGSATFTVRVTDEAGRTHTGELTIVVAEIDELASGAAMTGLDGDSAGVRYYAVEVPSGATQLSVKISGGSGDADLYLRHGALPGEFTYDCRPLREGNEETCTVTPPSPGHWYIMLRGFTDYTDVSLVATHDG